MEKKMHYSENRVLSRATVNSNTFRRPTPIPRKKYEGTILFAWGEYEDIAIIRSDFDKLPEFGAFYGHQMTFLTNMIKCDKNLREDFGSVFAFNGYYRQFANGNARFVGKITKIM